MVIDTFLIKPPSIIFSDKDIKLEIILVITSNKSLTYRQAYIIQQVPMACIMVYGYAIHHGFVKQAAGCPLRTIQFEAAVIAST